MVFFNSAFLFAQNCGIQFSGKILDNHDQSPLAYATVFIEELEQGVVADSTGAFQFENICPGAYHIKISHAECEPIIIEISLSKSIKQNLFLEHHHLEEIEVFGAINIGNSGKQKDEVSGKELDNLKGQNLGNILDRINGVSSLKTGNSISKPIIHGLHSSRITILNNYIIQESQQWGVDHAPEVDPFALGKIELVKGSEVVKYGPGAIGGVIILSPKDLPDSAGIHGGVDLILNTNGFGTVVNGEVEGMFKKTPGWSWRLQGSYKKAGNMNASDYFIANTGTEEYNYSVNTSYMQKRFQINVFYSSFNTKIGIFKGAHIGNLSDLEAAINADKPFIQEGFKYDIERPFQKVNHHLLKLGSWLKTGDKGTLYFDFGYQKNIRQEFDSENSFGNQDDNFAEMQFYLSSFYGNVHWEHNYHKGFKGKIGVNYIGSQNLTDGKFYLIPNYNKYGAGVYFIETWTKRKLKLELGVRFDMRYFNYYFYQMSVIQEPQKNWNNVSANFGLQYRFSKENQLGFSVYRGWRNPEPNELYSDGLHHGAASIEYGNPDLKAEVSYGSNINFLHTSELFKIEIEGYVNYIQNFIYQQPGLPELTIRGAFPTFYFEQTDALLTGADVSISYFPRPNLEWNLNGSVLWAFNQNSGEYIPQMPADRIGSFLKYIFTSKSKNISEPYLKLSGVGVSRQWKHPSEDNIYGVPAAYVLVNFEAGLDINLQKGALFLGLEVQNLLNAKYRDYLNRYRFYTDDLGIGCLLKIKYQI